MSKGDVDLWSIVLYKSSNSCILNLRTGSSSIHYENERELCKKNGVPSFNLARSIQYFLHDDYVSNNYTDKMENLVQILRVLGVCFVY
jgi:hypothetical protein